MNPLLGFVVAMGITMLLVPMLTRRAERWRFLDAPGPRKVHQQPMPRIGGIAMAIGVCVPLLVAGVQDRLLVAYLVAALMLLAAGIWDDRKPLDYRPKFAMQVAAALVVMQWGGVLIHSVTLTDRIEIPPEIGVPLTLLFLVGVTNAINLSDGLDGLAGGTTLLSCLAIAMLGLSARSPFVVTVATVTAGSILGFLRYNTYPARVFMGDSGSQFLGFTVAVLAILLTQGNPVPISAALPLLLLGLPIVDTLSVMTQRISEGRSPFAADRNHIHHKLLAMGFDHHEAVAIIYGLQSLLFVAAWFMRFESDLRIVATFAVFAAGLVGVLFVAGRSGWRVRKASSGVSSGGVLARAWRRLLQPHRLARWSLVAGGVGAAAYSASIVIGCRDVPGDVGLLAAGVLVAMAVTAAFARGPVPSGMVKGALYVGTVIIVYLDIQFRGEGGFLQAYEAAVLGALAANVALMLGLTAGSNFKVTPLDGIVVFGALALPNLPGSLAASQDLGTGAVALLVLFYTVEILLNRSAAARRYLVGTAAVLLAIVAARAWF